MNLCHLVRSAGVPAMIIVLAGCATPVAPVKPKPAVAPPAPAAAAPKPVVATAPPAPVGPLKQTTEVLATVAHLTQAQDSGVLPHDLTDTTGFPKAIDSLVVGAAAPKIESGSQNFLPPAKGLTAEGNAFELVERDWTGLVLQPLNAALSKAHTITVRIVRIEAHPLSDGRVRVWLRVKNIGSRELAFGIACAFRMGGSLTEPSPRFYDLTVPSEGLSDVFFVSPAGQALQSYTVLVRRAGAK